MMLCSCKALICASLLVCFVTEGYTASPLPNNSGIPAAWGQRSIALGASNWVRLIDSLSSSLNTPVIAFVPQRWEVTSFRGRVTEVMDAIAQRAQGTWRFVDGCLLFVPDLAVSQGTEKAAAAARGFPSPLFEFLAGLDDAQLATIATGQTLPIASLSDRQRSVLSRALTQQGGISAEERNRILAQGQLACVLRAGAVLFWRGEELRRAQSEGLFEWEEGVVFTVIKAGRERDLSHSLSEAQSLVGATSTITLKVTAVYPLSQLQKLMQSSSKGKELILSVRTRQIPVVISKGRWQVAKILSLAQVVTHTELRKVGGLLFWEYTGATLNVHRLNREAQNCERLYPPYRRIVAALRNAPDNSLAPFTPEDLLQPSLKPYAQLTIGQKNFALEQYGLFCLLPPTEVEQRGTDIECFPFAWVQCIFIVPNRGGSPSHFVRWTGPVYNYAWLAHHAK